MKSTVKRLVSGMCVCALLTVPVVNTAFAAQYTVQNVTFSAINKNITIMKMTDKEIIQKMKDLGVTNSEISYIMQLEKKNREALRQQENSVRITAAKFPSNPKIGQKVKQVYKIGVATGSFTVGSVIGWLVGGGVPVTLAVGMASAILADLAADHDIKGIKITAEYVYGYTNDGELDWVQGKTDWTYY